jgi:cobalt-zinc-cadmium efflux system membrane fusion protein
MKNIKHTFTRYFLLSPIVFGLLFSISCNDKKQETIQVDKEETSNEVVLTESQLKTVGIKFGVVENRNLNTIIKANGYTTVPPQNAANISTLINGVIKEIFVLEGTFVQKGKILATIQNLEVIEIQESYKSAIANIEYLQLEYNRQKTLSDENVNPRKVFQEVKSKLGVERAKAQAAKAKLVALHMNPNSTGSLVPIVSPISGYVGKINITKGAFAETGITLFEVVDNSQMHLDLNVYEKDLGTISIGQEVDFVLTNQSNKSIKGQIFGINKSFSNESKTVAVHAKIQSSDAKDLISGMYVSANININNSTVPSLPKEAVVRNGDKYYVFILDDEHKEHPENTINENDTSLKKREQQNKIHFKAVEVVPGTTDLGYTHVKFVLPISNTTQFVVKGVFYLLSDLKGGGGHEH